jgi:hypothetical protein
VPNPKRLPLALTGALAAVMALSGIVAASHAENYSLFGDAQLVSPGNGGSEFAVQLRSDATPGFGGVDYGIPAGTTFADFQTLATDYWFEGDDSCGGGSPRFQINVEDPNSADDGNIFVYIGPPPAYTLCPSGVWLNTGDLLEGANPIDTSQLDLGTFYDPYAAAVAKYGDYVVTGVQLVVDGSWFPLFIDGEQTGRFDNTNIDGAIYTYERGHPHSRDDCKKGGWMELTRDDGTRFKNQGDCIQYFNTGK